ncbi:kynurenine formamidase-like [Rhodnius prolixus]|uniref:Uncharacterized protein n=1 Tax=Rhodnius prolixus TaxID=13249 RepID=T1I4K2_RHOPR
METFLIVLLATTLPWFGDCFSLKLVDLTYSYDNVTTSTQGCIPFRFETGEFLGTYMDAPRHFKNDALAIDEIHTDRFFVTGILIDATSETGTNSAYKLPEEKSIEWERLHGVMPDNSLVFVNYGWAKQFYPNRESYVGPSKDDFQFPGLSQEAALWIAGTKRIVGVAVDTPSVDQGSNREAHTILAENNIYTIQNVNLTEPLPHRFQAIAMPMKQQNGNAAPVRVAAISVDDD